ncbi:unnamed protein product [Vicia faba]|uniref:Syntaxin 6/10/61 N-terminal domain-containing protein n=1 Tax=Vicia faba TaxID=3906 RepID=A0AAV1APC2_VICFA|nr:unnamed protein product [Vicia faba]
MLVANSFDLWRKDTFFSAAEEVQESADIMESAYRAWLRERRERSNTADLNELCRELQTALGTAKWQLEEFEKAVRLSYRHLGDDNRATRHRQFISAMESQISQVEVTLREFYIEEGKQPLRWVNLGEEERDDFAAFLSGTCEAFQSSKDECMDISPSTKISLVQKQVNKEDKIVNANVNAFCSWDSSTNEKASMDVIAFNKGRDYAIEIKADEQRNELTRTIDANPKDKGIKPLFWKQKFEEYPQAMRAVHMFNQLFGRIGLCQRKLQSPLRLRRGHSLKVTLALMIIIFLLVPFVFYST